MIHDPSSPLSQPLGARTRLSRRDVVTTVALLVLATSLACVSKPTMQIRQAQVTGVGFMGIRLNVTAELHNPNGFDVMIRRVRMSATLANRYRMGPMEHDPNVWLPANQKTLVTMPVWIPWPMVPPLLAETLGSEEIPYHLEGEADVTATRMLGVRVNNERIDERGVIPRGMLLSAARTSIPGAR